MPGPDVDSLGFFPSCGFTTIPRQLSLVPNLRMLSFKSCQPPPVSGLHFAMRSPLVTSVVLFQGMLGGELLCSQLPKTIEWLILTGWPPYLLMLSLCDLRF